MSVEEMPDPEKLEREAVETILGDLDLRDELADHEAKPLIDWGLQQAAALARRAVAEAAMQSSRETLDESLSALRRLMKRVNRFVGHRAEGDVEQLHKDLERLAKFSEELFGDAVSRPDEVQVEAFLNEQGVLGGGQIVTRLLEMYAPPPEPLEQLTAPLSPERLTAPIKPDQLAAPPRWEQLTSPEPPDLLPSQGEKE